MAIVGLKDSDSGPGHAVTASITTEGDLRLVLWRVARDGASITREQAVVDGTRRPKELALSTANGHAVVAAIGTDGHLEVTSWGPALTTLGSARGAVGSRVAIAPVGSTLPDHLVTAMRDSVGHLRLDLWSVAHDGRVSHVDRARGKEIEEAKLAATGFAESTPKGGAATLTVLERLSGGDLVAETWDVTSFEPPFQFVPPSARSMFLGRAKRIAAPVSFSFRTSFVAAAENKDGELAIAVAPIDSVESTRGLQAVGGQISRVAACVGGELPDPSGHSRSDVLITAVRDHRGDLEVIAWRIGQVPVRDSELDGGGVLEVDVASVIGGREKDEHNVVVTAVRTADDELKVTAWRLSSPHRGT